jgi:hypothetical protein
MKPLTKIAIISGALLVMPSTFTLGLSIYGIYSIFENTTSNAIKQNCYDIIEGIHRMV